MAKWILKALVQRGIGMLPAAQFWNELFQIYITRSVVDSPAAVQDKLEHCRRHLEALRKYGSNKEDFTVFDLGTGWLPVVPVGMYLCGAKEVYTCDLAPLLKPARVTYVLQQIVEFAERGELGKLLPEFKPERLERVREVLRDKTTRTPAEMLKPLGIDVIIRDARAVELPAASVDLFCSTQVLESIPAPILTEIFTHFARLATPQPAMSHYIDLSDQYAAFDRSITPFNFLRFSNREWSWINNKIIPLTRLRIPEYRRVIAESGWKLAEEDNTVGQPDDLNRVPLAGEFNQYSREDLLVLRSWLMANR